MTLAGHDLEDLRRARGLLESSSLALRLTEALGQPIEKGLALLPQEVSAPVHRMTRAALDRALRVAVGSLGDRPRAVAADRLHRVAAGASGAVGGFFGLAGLAIELPLTTVIMLRSIGDVARAEGHDLTVPATQMACLEVFALGGRARRDDAAETGYYAVRGALAKALSEAARHVAQKGLGKQAAPVLVRAIETIAARFGVVVQEKIVLEGVPVAGAVGGSLINMVFMRHFQDRARGHFIVRRLETAYGAEVVRQAYEAAAWRSPPGAPAFHGDTSRQEDS